MNSIALILLAIALSIDAMIVSFSYGLTFTQDRLKNAMLLAFFTGIFQGIMPILGYFLATAIKTYIEPYAPIIIFTIFLFLGLKIIKESFEEKEKPHCIGLSCLFLIGVATSIDAFSAGITLLLMGNKILIPAILITCITFINSLLGFSLGSKLRHLPQKMLEIPAGLILIGLGIKAIL